MPGGGPPRYKPKIILLFRSNSWSKTQENIWGDCQQCNLEAVPQPRQGNALRKKGEERPGQNETWQKDHQFRAPVPSKPKYNVAQVQACQPSSHDGVQVPCHIIFETLCEGWSLSDSVIPDNCANLAQNRSKHCTWSKHFLAHTSSA